MVYLDSQAWVRPSPMPMKKASTLADRGTYITYKYGKPAVSWRSYEGDACSPIPMELSRSIRPNTPFNDLAMKFADG
jgi:hypothetical protein